MIALDDGPGLQRLLSHIAQHSERGDMLFAVVAFIDEDSHAWSCTLSAAKAGAGVRLITRPAINPGLTSGLADLRRLGGRVTLLPRVHAKAFIWFDASSRRRVAFVGSTNFTSASELRSIELGLLISGDGAIEDS